VAASPRSPSWSWPLTSTPTGEMSDIEIVPVAIGAYRHHRPLEVEAEVRRVVGLLAEFGGREVAWDVDMPERDVAAIHTRLQAWGAAGTHADTVLYWVGHGSFNGSDPVLAHAHSPTDIELNGIGPGQVGKPLKWRQNGGDGQWAIVVVDTCCSAAFVKELQNADVERVLLVGVSTDGATTLGRFSAALEACLTANFRADTRIEVRKLGDGLEDRLDGSYIFRGRLAGAALTRESVPLAATMPAALDVLEELERVVRALPADERRHFMEKAQAAEDGEVSWFFEGRERERQRIVSWLRTTRSGILAITGRAGAGKSALLGHCLVHSLPDLRDALSRAHLIAELPEAQRPPDRVFDAVIHLTGITRAGLVQRVADAFGFRQGFGDEDPVDWLTDHLRNVSGQVTLLLDALDEAQDPVGLAGGVLRRLAGLDRVRLVIGTRASTVEGPDHPAADDNVLAALALDAADSSILTLRPEPEAVYRFATNRLETARSAGLLVVNGHDDAESAIQSVAADLRDRSREFLFARLAVHEFIAQPTLLTHARRAERDALLAGSHRDLFTHAVARLTAMSPAFEPLLTALALARGRGLPIVDGVWASMATAIGPENVIDADVSALLDAAKPYVAVDADLGQTVYRLAHRAFAEQLTPGSSESERQLPELHQRIAVALIADAGSERGAPVSPYVRRHLSGHVGEAGLWQHLADHAAVLDRLDPTAVAADAMRRAFGRTELPAEIGGVLHGQHVLARVDPADRPGTRQLATATHRRHIPWAEAPDRACPWRLGWSAVRAEGLNMVITKGESVRTLAAATLPDGRTLLAAGDAGATVRLWDPFTGAQVGEELAGHAKEIRCVAWVSLPDGHVLLATGSEDATIRLWDPTTGRQRGRPLQGHRGRVTGAVALTWPGTRTLLATGGVDGTIRLWGPAEEAPVASVLTALRRPVRSMAAVRMADGRPLLAAGDDDGTVQLWDPATHEAVGNPMTGHRGPVWAIAAATQSNGETLLATAGADRAVRLWDPATGVQVGVPLTGHTDDVLAVAPVTMPDGRTLLATGSSDETVRLWDPGAGQPVGEPLTGHAGWVLSVASVNLPDGRVRLVTSGEDGTIRLWDPASSAPTSGPEHAGAVRALAEITMPDGRTLLATGSFDKTVRLWDLATGEPAGGPLIGHTGPVLAVAGVKLPGGRTLLATGSTDKTVRLWDPTTSEPVGDPLAGHTGSVQTVAAVRQPNGHIGLATGSSDETVMLWDLATGAVTGSLLVDARFDPPDGKPPDGKPPDGKPPDGKARRAPLSAAISVPGGPTLLATASLDETVRLWDAATGAQVGAAQVGAALIDPPERITAVAALPTSDGRTLLATGSDAATVRLWDPATGTSVGEPLAGHTQGVSAAACVNLPDGRTLLATGDRDGTVRLWDVATNKIVHALPIGEEVHALSAIPAGIAPGGAAALAVGVQTGVLVLALDESLFPALRTWQDSAVR
jgi:WD40 repeat protein